MGPWMWSANSDTKISNAVFPELMETYRHEEKRADRGCRWCCPCGGSQSRDEQRTAGGHLHRIANSVEVRRDYRER